MRSSNPVFIKHTGEDTFIFRTPYTRDELKELFALRYRVFRETKGDFLFEENPYEMDIDVYDLRAHHFGLYKCKKDRQVCVGHMRLVIANQETHIAPMVREIADDIPDLDPNWDAPPKFCLPHFQLIDDKIANAITHQALLEDLILVETSRYCTDTEAQAISIARFMVSSIIEAAAHYFTEENRVYVMVSQPHATFYKAYGFEVVRELIPLKTSEKYVIMMISISKVNELLLMAQEFPTQPLHKLTYKKELSKAA